MKIACVQTDVVWQKPERNMQHIESLLDGLHSCDLIVLPEMYNTGFALNEQHADEDSIVTQRWMHKIATEKRSMVCGSLKVRDKNKVFNRFIAVSPNGPVATYDKVHLFAQEREVLSAGNKRVTFECNGFRILPQICYDLRFPVFSRNQNDYDLAIYVASWPKPRIHHWDALLQARAIENLSYVIGVNRIGNDGNNWQYVGHSQVISPMGEVLNHARNEEQVLSMSLDLNEVINTRKQLAYLSDGDRFSLN